MVTTEVFMDILALYRQGHSMRWIAKKLGIHRNTVKKYITERKSPQYRKQKVNKGSVNKRASLHLTFG